jgi:hypothetical protein
MIFPRPIAGGSPARSDRRRMSRIICRFGFGILLGNFSPAVIIKFIRAEQTGDPATSEKKTRRLRPELQEASGAVPNEARRTTWMITHEQILE